VGGDKALLAAFAEAIDDASEVDEIVDATLRTLVGLDGVVRAGLALPVVGGRQLRFLSSDAERLGPPPQWCLIDAYDSLPLNDAVRTGRDIVLETPAVFGHAYPELAAHQRESGVRSVVALALVAAGQPVGGLLVYRDSELTAMTAEAIETLRALAGHVAAALAAAHDVDAASGDDVSSAAGNGGSTVHSTLPADATAPGAARRFVARTLESWQLAQGVIDAAVLCASELVTNVVVHARRASVITLERRPSSLTVAVHQPRGPAGPPIEPIDPSDLLAIAGRGLTLVHALSSRWGSEPTSDGTRVWFQIDVAA
jgi:anti-sigma regulatory factor (Ser/Thr protein kinase)